jgi:hypothetical protein
MAGWNEHRFKLLRPFGAASCRCSKVGELLYGVLAAALEQEAAGQAPLLQQAPLRQAPRRTWQLL